MRSKSKKGFTLIELIGVLVIMAIIALIVTPLVMNIIRKARVAADKRSIDAYGRSIEYAIAGYLLDNGKFPTDISLLTIEYSGSEEKCSTTQLNSDSSVYLTGCTVDGRTVEGYIFGKEETVTYDAYNLGDQVTYNNVNYYVIEDSETTESTVKLLKAEPLTVSEVNTYGGVGTANNHVNMNVPSNEPCYQTAKDVNGYGGMQYYSSATCLMFGDSSGCTTSYASSDIKYVVDRWAEDQAPNVREARLIFKEEYENMLIVETYETPTEPGKRYTPMYDWQYSSNYGYWTISAFNDSTSVILYVSAGGSLGTYGVSGSYTQLVRPVIVLPKSAISS